MNRLHIRLYNQNHAAEFVSALNNWTDRFILENEDGLYRVNAKSIIGVLYFCADHNADCYLVNLTSAGYYPDGVMKFRV